MGLKRARLSAVSLGVAVGLIKGICMLAVALSVMYGGAGDDMIKHWATFYPGVEATVKGAFVAGAWGYVTGFFTGLFLGWIYNLCLCCCSRGHCSCCCKTTCETPCGPKV